MFLRSARIPNYTLGTRRGLVPAHSPYLPGHPLAMLTDAYIEALLVDEDLADQVWEAWDKGEIDDQVACYAWLLVCVSRYAMLNYASR